MGEQGTYKDGGMGHEGEYEDGGAGRQDTEAPTKIYQAGTKKGIKKPGRGRGR